MVQVVQAETTARMKRELEDLVNFYRGAVALTAHAGPRGALPHGQPGPVAIKPGDTLIVGHRRQGRRLPCRERLHLCGGRTDSRPAPLPGGHLGLRRSGICGAQTWSARAATVNEAAWAVLRERGYGDFIRHRIGHGMGVEGHEAPWLSIGDATPAAAGMIFSNEPGIYRPGIDGYRIIDSMVVTDDGAERLSRYLVRARSGRSGDSVLGVA